MDYIKDLRKLVSHQKIILNFVGACIVNEKKQILLQKRADKQVWGFPGGAVELGESLEEALIREIKEETGLEVSIKKLLGIYSKYEDHYPNGDIAQPITHFFLVDVRSGKLAKSNAESLALQYFSLSDFPPLVNQQHEDMKIDIEKFLDADWSSEMKLR